MTRDEFLKRLDRGLVGMPETDREDILRDYSEHFDAGGEDGRSEAEVALALGEPGRLARELKLEAGIRRWEESRSPASALAAIVAFLGLGAIDILILLPILLPAIGVIFALYVAMLAIFIAGAVVLIVGPFNAFPGGTLAAILAGLGMMSAAIAITALLTVITIWLINALMWFGRLHYSVLKPAIEPQTTGGTTP